MRSLRKDLRTERYGTHLDAVHLLTLASSQYNLPVYLANCKMNLQHTRKCWQYCMLISGFLNRGFPFNSGWGYQLSNSSMSSRIVCGRGSSHAAAWSGRVRDADPRAERGCVEDQPQHVGTPERTAWIEPAAAGFSSLRSSKHSRAPLRASAFTPHPLLITPIGAGIINFLLT